MTLDIRGSLKNTRLSQNSFVVVEELLSNSIDAFLIRRSQDDSELSLEVELSISTTAIDLVDDVFDLEITCRDNGCGLGPEQIRAFLTKDTSYKDDLNIPGIGQCKGAGRIQFFHHFESIEISSIYKDGDGLKKVFLPSARNRKKIDESDFQTSAVEEGNLGTSIRLSSLQEKLRETIFSSTDFLLIFKSDIVRQHVLFSFLQRFVGLKTELGDFSISIISNLNGTVSNSKITASDIPASTSSSVISITHKDEDKNYTVDLTVTHYKLNESDFNLPRNLVALCAKDSIVKIITSRYLRPQAAENNPIDGHYHIILVEGDLLDRSVNEQRDGFDKIPEDNSEGDLFAETKISFEDIFDVLDEKVHELINPPDWSREKIVSDLAEQFGVSENMLTQSDTRVRFGDNAETVASRALAKLQKKVIEDTSHIFNMRDSIKKTEPDSDSFRKQINEISWRFASTIKTIDMANLSQLVVRRAALIDVLEMATKRELSIQSEHTEGRRKDEALIHNIFFPMRKDSEEISDHDIWLLSEEFHYYDYIASDMPLSQIKWDGSNILFESDIDEELQNLLERTNAKNSKHRPDIALFSEEGSAVIVEFKSPGVSVDDHIGDLMEYAQLLAAKSGGRLKKFYGYLIGDTANLNRLFGYQPLPGAKGYFNTSDVYEPTSRQRLGELYSEILFYEDIVDRARKRIRVYRERLNLPPN